MDDARSLLTLLRGCASAGPLRTLLDRFGDAGAALAAGPSAWRDAGVAGEQFIRLQTPDAPRLEADLAWLAHPNHHLVGWHSADYPALLRRIAHPPAALFILGDPDLLWHPQVAVVGSRHPSAGGRDNARQFARAFGRSGFAVTSGLAEGIDTAAHLGALETHRTIAVIATGPDLCFPASNEPLMARIAATGAVVSEHPPGTPGRREHFPSRNRLIAGLALGTVVIEAAMRSGALITARLAAESGREVFALPGSIHNPLARGCHRLIRQGVGLVEAPAEVIEALAPVAADLAQALRGRLDAIGPPPSDAPTPSAGTGLAGPERIVWQALGHDPVNLDQLAGRTGLTVAALSAMLLSMELEGQISVEHGRYTRRS